MSQDGITVLAVDDDEQALNLLLECLDIGGYKTLSAMDGKQGLEVLRQNLDVVDVIIADRNMPVMNGMEMLKEIKRDVATRNIPVIFQTGLTAQSDIAEGIQAGVYYYLTKPYDPSVLLSVVESALVDHERYKRLQDDVAEYAKTLTMMYSGYFRFQTLDEGRKLAILLANVYPDPAAVVTGLSELFINSVEHGNLALTYEDKTSLLKEGRLEQEIDSRLDAPEYSNKFTEVRLDRDQSTIRLSVTDMGEGFDPAPYMEMSAERATHTHGRGIAMARMMSFDSVKYRGKGNVVLTTVNLESSIME